MARHRPVVTIVLPASDVVPGDQQRTHAGQPRDVRTAPARRSATSRPRRDAKVLPSLLLFSETTGHSCRMAKLIGDNRVILVLFVFLAFLNAFAIQGNWYA